MIKKGKIYIIFYGKRKYEGEVLEVSESFVKLNDKLEGEILLPKGNIFCKEVQQDD